MGDQLEKYIMEHREGFDDAEPSQNLWNAIDQRLDRKKPNYSMVWKVAAVLFLVSTIVLLLDRRDDNYAGPALSQEFMEAEDYYINLISQRKQLITEKLTPEQEEAFLMEINDLDSMYLELKKTYQVNATNERIMDAMINNLQLRLDILNRQVEILENIKGQTDANETIIEI